MKLLIAIILLALLLSTPAVARDPEQVLVSGEWEAPLLTLERFESGNGFREIPPAVRLDLLAILLAYPTSCADVQMSPDNRVVLVMRDGIRIVYDDGKKKTFEQKLKDPDLEDMLSQIYDPGTVARAVPVDFDPGRFRVDTFFRTVYGADKTKVKANLTPVDFLGTRVWFNKRDGAAQALQRVAMELRQLVKETPDLSNYILPIGGSFSYRLVKGTERLSPHSYGIAIDLNPRKGAYWRWGKRPPNLLDLRIQYPCRIVSVFEKHGFIWGGKWYHYDLMHLEYRPELLLKSRLIKAFSAPHAEN